jgi:hypothetical protein
MVKYLFLIFLSHSFWHATFVVLFGLLFPNRFDLLQQALAFLAQLGLLFLNVNYALEQYVKFALVRERAERAANGRLLRAVEECGRFTVGHDCGEILEARQLGFCRFVKCLNEYFFFISRGVT